MWGYFEWDGAWSRKSAFWTQDIKEILKPSLGEDDGTFWMSYDDFLKHFVALNVTKVRPTNEIRLKGKFVRVIEDEKPTDVVMSKWFYCFELTKKATVQIGIH